MIRPIILLASAAIITAHAAPQAAMAQSVSDFRLPPSGAETPAVDPQQQGPVAQDVPESRPQPSPTPAPAPTRRPPVVNVPTSPTATPVVQPTPRASRSPETRPSPTPTRSPATSPAATSAPASTSDSAGTAMPSPAATATSTTPATADNAPLIPPLPTATPATASPADQESDLPVWLLWLAGILAVLAAVVLLIWQNNRRGMPVARKIAPIERPQLPPVADVPAEPPVVAPPAPVPAAPAPVQASAAAPVAPAPTPAPVPAPAPAAPAAPIPATLTLDMEALRFGLTLMNATLPYRLTLANGHATPLHGLRVTVDMISAHASLSREEQLSGPPAGLAPAHRIEQIAAGDSHQLKGELRLPFPQIVPIRQGNITLMLPLVRFRVESDDGEVATRVFVVGQAGADPGAGLQPFRLDQGPRNFTQVAQRAFA